MTLYEGNIHQDLQVTGLRLQEAVMRRLSSLGILEGTRVSILNKKKNGAVIIKVRGARWAIGREIVKGIDVEEWLDEKDN